MSRRVWTKEWYAVNAYYCVAVDRRCVGVHPADEEHADFIVDALNAAEMRAAYEESPGQHDLFGERERIEHTFRIGQYTSGPAPIVWPEDGDEERGNDVSQA